MGKTINCKEIVQNIKDEVSVEVAKLPTTPCLLVIQVGDNKASEVYVRNKERVCQEVGITSSKIHLPEYTTEEQLVKHIYRANNDTSVTGILVQLPLPKHINEQRVMELINPNKDVDGFHPLNAGRLFQGDTNVPVPCTPQGVMRILEEENVELSGKEVVVIGRSNIVGKPMSMLLQQANATVTMCHSRTKDLASHTRGADVVVAAVGIPKFITSEHIKWGATIIDVGINRDENGKLCGDCDTDDILNVKDTNITPVPGGVGLLTVACLMKNVLKCYKLQK